MSCTYRRLPLVLLGLLALLAQNTFASVLAIDYGSDWIKASLMKPGVPFDVLLNKDSKRKIQSSVAWKNTDRLFGGYAANIVRILLRYIRSLIYFLPRCIVLATVLLQASREISKNLYFAFALMRCLS